MPFCCCCYNCAGMLRKQGYLAIRALVFTVQVHVYQLNILLCRFRTVIFCCRWGCKGNETLFCSRWPFLLRKRNSISYYCITSCFPPTYFPLVNESWEYSGHVYSFFIQDISSIKNLLVCVFNAYIACGIITKMYLAAGSKIVLETEAWKFVQRYRISFRKSFSKVEYHVVALNYVGDCTWLAELK